MKKNLFKLSLLLSIVATSCSESTSLSPILEEKTPNAQMRSISAEDSDPFFTSFKPSDEYQMLFADRFTSDNIESGNNWWNYRTETIHYTYSNFTGYSRKQNVTINDGILSIKFDKSATGNYYGGGIISEKEFGYGYYELRVKVYTNKLGFHQSFWSRSPAVEVDGFELESGTTPNHSIFKNCKHRWLPGHVKYITTDAEESRFLATGNNVSPGGIWQTDDGYWKTVSYEWLPDRINFYIDGVKKNTFYNHDSQGHDLDVFAPSKVYITGLPLKFQISDVLTDPDDNASMQVESFAFSAKKLIGQNLLGNGDFELMYDPTRIIYSPSWSDHPILNSNGTIIHDGDIDNTNITTTSGRGGSNAFKLENKAIAHQDLYYIPNGKYTLSAWIKCSDPNFANGNRMQILVEGKNYEVLSAAQNNTTDGPWSKKTMQGAHSQWLNVKIQNIVVEDNTAHIIFCNKFFNNQTGYLIVDDVSFYAE